MNLAFSWTLSKAKLFLYTLQEVFSGLLHCICKRIETITVVTWILIVYFIFCYWPTYT